MFRKLLAAAVAPAAVLGGLAFSAAAAHATPAPLQVTLGTQVAGDGSSAVFDSAGDIVLTLGVGTGTTGAFAELPSAAGQSLPATPPSFTTSAYNAGSPRWVIKLSNGESLWGYPAQLGAGAKTDFTGSQWAVDNGNTYEAYTTAVTAALKGASGVTVKDAQVVADGDQSAGTADTLTGLQYGGQLLGKGAVTVTPVADQSVTVGGNVSVPVSATTTSSNKSGITFAATGLPAGLAEDKATGVIYGTVGTAAGSGTATVTATDTYGATGTTSIKFNVSQPVTPPAPVPYVYGGHVVTVNNNSATVGWSNSATGWPNKSQCVEVWISGYGFGAWNQMDPTNPGTSHVGFTCNNGDQTKNLGFLRGLARNHTYALRIVPATGTYGAGNNHPIPGAHVGYVDVFTTNAS